MKRSRRAKVVRAMAWAACSLLATTAARAAPGDEAAPGDGAPPADDAAPADAAPLPIINSDAVESTHDEGPVEPEVSQKSCTVCRNAVGGQALWVVGKFVPELAARLDLHRFFWLDFELGLAFLTSPPPGDDRVVLGSPLGLHFMFVPLRHKSVELAAGTGMDAHALWGVGPGIWEFALSANLSGTAWIAPRLALFASARAYPLATRGLDLGERRNGRPGLPVLFATGVQCALP